MQAFTMAREETMADEEVNTMLTGTLLLLVLLGVNCRVSSRGSIVSTSPIVSLRGDYVIFFSDARVKRT